MVDPKKPLYKDLSFMTLMVLVVLSVVWIYVHGINFGIDFVGGTRIPMTLEHPVDQQTMDLLIDTIKKRVSSFGLVQVNVYARGNDEVVVELPFSNPDKITEVEKVISKPGKFKAVIDGRLALTDEDILQGSIRILTRRELRNIDSGAWGVSFYVTENGARHFTEVAKGNGNKPVYMFLDRPEDAILLIPMSDLKSNAENLSEEDILTIVNDALRLEGDNIQLYVLDNFDDYKDQLTPNDPGHTKAIVPEDASPEIKQFLKDKGFVVVEASHEDLKPRYTNSPGYQVVEGWPAIGLITSPRLSPDIATGAVKYSYSITGVEDGNTPTEKAQNALAKAQLIKSVLQGGALPVGVNIESKTTISAPLGQDFLRMSLIGGGIAVLVVALVVAIRYREWKIVLPVLFESACELIILIAIIGSFTIDLGAFAGIIAAVGTSVDDQIVITDELLKPKGTKSQKIKRAFSIVTLTRTVAIVSMLPLLFSGITEVMGFATSTLIGALLGLLVSRRAFAAIIVRVID